MTRLVSGPGQVRRDGAETEGPVRRQREELQGRGRELHIGEDSAARDGGVRAVPEPPAAAPGVRALRPAHRAAGAARRQPLPGEQGPGSRPVVAQVSVSA